MGLFDFFRRRRNVRMITALITSAAVLQPLVLKSVSGDVLLVNKQ